MTWERKEALYASDKDIWSLKRIISHFFLDSFFFSCNFNVRNYAYLLLLLLKSHLYQKTNPDTVLCSVVRAPGHSSRCVPGCEGPEAGGIVEGGCFIVDWQTGGGPACSDGEPSAVAAGSGQCRHTPRHPGCGEKYCVCMSKVCLHAQVSQLWSVF